MTNHQPTDPATDETSHVTIPATRSECANPVEAALWRALREARRERDEARREVCKCNSTSYPHDMKECHEIAESRGWDCFSEDGK